MKNKKVLLIAAASVLAAGIATAGVASFAWYTATASATATVNGVSDVITTSTTTAAGVAVELTVDIKTTTAPELSDSTGAMKYIVDGGIYDSTSAASAGVGKYEVKVAFKTAGDASKWAASATAKDVTITISAKTLANSVNVVLLDNGAANGATPAGDARTHAVVLNIGATGTITYTTINGQAAVAGTNAGYYNSVASLFAARPQLEGTTAEAAMPSGGYTSVFFEAAVTSQTNS